MPTFQVKSSDIAKELFEITGPEAHHLIRVLRVKPGEQLRLADGKGNVYTGIVAAVGKGVTVKITGPLASPPPPFPLHLYLSLLKSEKMEWIVQKAVELNMEAIHLFGAIHSVRADLSPSKWNRLVKITESAAKQCGRSSPLLLTQRKEETTLLFERESQKPTTHLICLESGKRKTLRDFFATSPPPPPYALWIGPEGGWSVDETKTADRLGFTPVSLGPLILRAETAAIHAMSSVLALAF
ncbi:MAG: 16S rRNA (uracil(1498)-N(3))-methyltransferase [Deltaproteobacteria bacterium]|nr:16S rRNA (uracil(1498)-N(3))-methyltransferase [Deltaproteobacteria bacterium]